MSNLLQKKDKGFTLIEIVLVLAIAGLLMVIVFLAVSGAQKARRDTQRKSDVGRIAASLDQFASNGNGSYPNSLADWNTFWSQYVTTGNYNDPGTGTTYTPGGFSGNLTPPAPTVPSSGTAAGVTLGVAGRTYNICIGLEQGTQACRSNQ